MDRRIALVINTTEGQKALADSFTLRRSALNLGVPYVTTIAAARAAVFAIEAARTRPMEVAPLQHWHPGLVQ